MTNQEAKKVLSEMGLETFDRWNLSCEDSGISARWWFVKGVIKSETRLDGVFTAEQLEAIAAWLKDPNAVASAESL